MTVTLHPTTRDLAFCIRVEFELVAPCPPLEAFPGERFEAWYRALWSAIDTGAPTRWGEGIGLDAARVWAEQTARNQLAAVPGGLAIVLRWLDTWYVDRQRGHAALARARRRGKR